VQGFRVLGRFREPVTDLVEHPTKGVFIVTAIRPVLSNLVEETRSTTIWASSCDIV